MQVRYVDEYGTRLYWGDVHSYPPSIGDSVIIDDEDYRVKSRTFIPTQAEVIVELTQNQIKAKSEDEVGGRLTEMQRAIVDVNKRQDAQEKKSRFLGEQLVSVRTYIRNKNGT